MMINKIRMINMLNVLINQVEYTDWDLIPDGWSVFQKNVRGRWAKPHTGMMGKPVDIYVYECSVYVYISDI